MYLNIANIFKNSILHKLHRNMFLRNTISALILLTVLTTVHSCGPGRGLGGHRGHRKLIPLVYKQHVPNLSENTLGASGLREGKIMRDDPKFRDLVPNYNKDIIFKDEEGTGADRLMTQRCKEKLNSLAVSVMNQWPGIKLRVTESWDEDDHHGSQSLHYEGRAIDITTSDRDRSKYGLLARLAVEAGFDWVYYESRSHIHCSVKSDSSQESKHIACFSGDSTVLTSTGKRRYLSDLQIGEKVLTMTKTGDTAFSEVLMFLDRDTKQKQEFVKFSIDGGATLKVTDAHLVMAWNPAKNLSNYIFAGRIEEGDYLLVNLNTTLVPRKVIHVSTTLSKGVYAPLTREGTIIVDSVAASCYALVNSQLLAHIGFLPIRAANIVWHWFNDNSVVTSRQNGMHWYAEALYSIKDYIFPDDWLYH